MTRSESAICCAAFVLCALAPLRSVFGPQVEAWERAVMLTLAVLFALFTLKPEGP